MNRDERVFSSWELEKLNELVEVNKRDNAVKEGHEEATEQYIKNMLKENLSIDLIAKITNKTKEEILKIKETLE